MSAESGISTFRDSGGLWEQFRVEDVATPEGYQRNPELVLRFYNERRKQLLGVSPNKGHELLAALEANYEVQIITQNVDNLHERAGSKNVLHLHGELTKVTSSFSPNDPRFIKELTPEAYEIKIGDTAPDGSQYRPYIVWFGEQVPNIEPAVSMVQEADILFIIGTSMQVYPAAGLLHYARPDTPIYLIDPNEVNVPAQYNIRLIRKGASEGLEEVIKYLNEQEVQTKA